MSMLDEAANAQQPVPQPDRQQAGPNQPVPANPTEGTQVSPEVKPLVDEATRLLYDENFENLIKMFKQYGDDGFSDAMALAIMGVLERLEKEHGELPTEVLAQVGVKIFEMLLEDLVHGGVVAHVTEEQVLDAIQNLFSMWSEKHPNRVDQEGTARGLNNLAMGMQQ